MKHNSTCTWCSSVVTKNALCDCVDPNYLMDKWRYIIDQMAFAGNTFATRLNLNLYGNAIVNLDFTKMQRTTKCQPK